MGDAAVRLLEVGRGEPLPGELRRRVDLLHYVEKVKPIVEDVRRRGYEAVREYTLRFDGVDVEDPRVPREVLEEAYAALPERLRWALRVAASALRRFHYSTRPPSETWVPGARLRLLPVRRVGAYAPGGAHPYPSTVLHTVIPARAAGAGRVVVATPPRRGGGDVPVSGLMLAAAYVAGADMVYAVGGAQAVAALAYGAGPVERVDKVVGPGNPYVQAAKLLVSGDVGVDMVAGPTELAVVADESAEAEAVALDMLAEAEHGPLSVAALFTGSRRLAEEVAALLEKRAVGGLGMLYVVVAADTGEALRLADEMAAEHLVLYLGGELREEALRGDLAAGVVAAGVPPALLDYAYGPSHVLPTGGAARWRGGLCVYDFLRPIAYVDDSLVGRELLEASIVLAEAEGFGFHAESLRHRLRRLEESGEAGEEGGGRDGV